MQDEEFWNLTPVQLEALVEQYNNEQERQNARAALICAVMANIWRDKKSKTYKLEDFMLTQKQKNMQKQTPEQMFETVKLMNAAMGGELKVIHG